MRCIINEKTLPQKRSERKNQNKSQLRWRILQQIFLMINLDKVIINFIPYDLVELIMVEPILD